MDSSYILVGRIRNGNKIIGYRLKSSSGEHNVSREQMVCLLGAKKINNCASQIYKGKVIIRGLGIDINKLPVVDYDNNNENNDE